MSPLGTPTGKSISVSSSCTCPACERSCARGFRCSWGPPNFLFLLLLLLLLPLLPLLPLLLLLPLLPLHRWLLLLLLLILLWPALACSALCRLPSAPCCNGTLCTRLSTTCLFFCTRDIRALCEHLSGSECLRGSGFPHISRVWYSPPIKPLQPCVFAARFLAPPHGLFHCQLSTLMSIGFPQESSVWYSQVSQPHRLMGFIEVL